jgi:hypothetical protein
MSINVNPEEVAPLFEVCEQLSEFNMSYDFIPRFVFSIDILPKEGSMVEWWTNGGWRNYVR